MSFPRRRESPLGFEKSFFYLNGKGDAVPVAEDHIH